MNAKDTIEIIVAAIIETIKEYPLYFLAIAVLLILLLMLLMHDRRKAKKIRQKLQNIQPTYTGPKYAAGGEMDSLRHQRVYHAREESPLHAIILILALMMAVPYLISQHFPENILRQYFPQGTPQSQIQTPTKEDYANRLKTVKMDIESTFNEERTQLIITTTYRNEGAQTVYGITPKVEILDNEGNILQEQSDEMIPALGPKKSVTRTIVVKLEIPYTDIQKVYERIHYTKTH